MILDISTQIGYFASTIISGFIVGIMFDIYRIIRGANPPSKIIAAISDILFWILQSLIVFVFLMATNSGNLRYYTIVGLLLGLIVYFKVMSKLIQVILIRILMFISKIFSIIKNVILIPFKLMSYILSHVRFNVNKIGYSIHKKKLDKNTISKKEEKSSLEKENIASKENKITRRFFLKKKKKAKFLSGKSNDKDAG